MNPRNLFAELKRRNVYKVRSLSGCGWLLVQVALRFFVLEIQLGRKARHRLVVIGFPIALVIAGLLKSTQKELNEPKLPMRCRRQRDRKSMPGFLSLLSPRRSRSRCSFSAATRLETNSAALPNESLTKSIAVLPFVNMSSDKEQDYFSDGLSEDC